MLNSVVQGKAAFVMYGEKGVGTFLVTQENKVMLARQYSQWKQGNANVVGISVVTPRISLLGAANHARTFI